MAAANSWSAAAATPPFAYAGRFQLWLERPLQS